MSIAPGSFETKNTVWCTDFTYLYLTNGTVRKALIATGCNPAKLILHSDQGSQFTSVEFIDFNEDKHEDLFETAAGMQMTAGRRQEAIDLTGDDTFYPGNDSITPEQHQRPY